MAYNTQNTQHHPQYIHAMSPPPHPSHIPSLTTILINNSPGQLQAATQHPFLRLAGLGQLPKHILSRWLSQDRLYAQAYIGFIGSLIARVVLPHPYVHDQSTSLRWRIVNMLSSAMTNIHRELNFFSTTARKYGLDLEMPAPNSPAFEADSATMQYIELFRAFGSDPSMSLLEGMIVLWATETVYLRAWTYAASFGTAPSTSEKHTINKPIANTNNESSTPATPFSAVTSSSNVDSEGPIPVHTDYPGSLPSSNRGSKQIGGDLDGGALRNEFIPNWTSPEFVEFVREIADLTDLLAQREDAVVRKLEVYKSVWRHILDIESRFWPSVDHL
ncbi:hypothetical protein B0A52_07934 [Exophiala mesophila]|uniref:Thiaminase-2/PQQC domain-containing protein n=1 Tax=Exophiala mesophila TaxID=212818 RepID=A0A438MXM8_EXOME|nr:hypothetical protein B0A52_07934 [Exophiala mesophila]